MLLCRSTEGHDLASCVQCRQLHSSVSSNDGQSDCTPSETLLVPYEELQPKRPCVPLSHSDHVVHYNGHSLIEQPRSLDQNAGSIAAVLAQSLQRSRYRVV